MRFGAAFSPSIGKAGMVRRSFWLSTVSMLALCSPFGLAPATAQTVIDYDAGGVGAAPLVLTADTILDRDLQNTAAADQSGTISGAFNLTKTGWGNLRLSAANAGYSGTTTIQEGYLTLADDQALGSGALHIAAGAGIFIAGDRTLANNVVLDGPGWMLFNTGADALTLNGVVSGTGGLRKESGSTLVLNAANTYSGGTQINNGTIEANHNNAFGTGIIELHSAGAIALGGGISINNNIELTGTAATNADLSVTTGLTGRLHGNISERFAGLGFNKTGGGVLELFGNNSYTGVTRVQGGTLVAAAPGAFSQLSDFQVDAGAILELQHAANLGSLAGTGMLDTTSYLATLGYSGRDATFAGQVIGTGTVAKRGAGTQRFTGNSAGFNGDLFAEVGTLLINADFGNSAAFSLTGSTLGGTGTVAGLDATGGGTIAPGDGPGDIGTFTVGNRANFGATSILSVDVNAQGQSDLLSVGDTATLAGQVDVRAAAGNYAPSTSYRIVTTGAGYSGLFSGVTTNLAFLTPELVYEATDVWLTLARNARSFSDIDGLSFNQLAVAPAAEALGGGNAVYDALLSRSEDEARAGFDSLSGDMHVSIGTLVGGNSQLVGDTLLNRMRGAGSAARTGVLSDLDTGSPADRAVPSNPWQIEAWSAGLGGLQHLSSDGNAAGISSATGGVLFGLQADHQGGYQLGIAAGYSVSGVDGPGASSADIDTLHLAAYGAGQLGDVAIRLGGTYGQSGLDTTREVVIGGFSDTLTASYNAHAGQVFGELGYRLVVGSTMVEPFVGLNHIAVGADGFTEAGGAAALSTPGFSQGTTFGTLGLRATHQLQASEHGILTASAGVAWRHAFDTDAPLGNFAFAAGGPFTIAGLSAPGDSLLLEAGLDWQLDNGLNLGADYNGAISGSGTSHSLKADLAVRF